MVEKGSGNKKSPPTSANQLDSEQEPQKNLGQSVARAGIAWFRVPHELQIGTMRLVVKVGTSLIAPNGHIDTMRIRTLVDQLDLSLEKLCNGHGKQGTGGIRSKLRAAKVASEAGVHVAIVNGRDPQAIVGALERKIGTYFPPRRRTARNGHGRQLPLSAARTRPWTFAVNEE